MNVVKDHETVDAVDVVVNAVESEEGRKRKLYTRR